MTRFIDIWWGWVVGVKRRFTEGSMAGIEENWAYNDAARSRQGVDRREGGSSGGRREEPRQQAYDTSSG